MGLVARRALSVTAGTRCCDPGVVVKTGGCGYQEGVGVSGGGGCGYQGGGVGVGGAATEDLKDGMCGHEMGCPEAARCGCETGRPTA